MQRTCGAAFNPEVVVERLNWGILELHFTSCHAGTIHYPTKPGAVALLSRLTLIEDLSCEAKTPGLAAGAGVILDNVHVESETLVDRDGTCWLRVHL